MRSIRALLIGLPFALGAGAAHAAPGAPVPCESPAPGRQALEVSCPLKGTEKPQRYRFRASFSGSHDDTTVSITPTLDGAPLACDAGSTTSLTGEDGDITLECRFSLADPADASRLLRVRVAWYHAWYTDFALTAD
jgi:hypothetical protein